MNFVHPLIWGNKNHIPIIKALNFILDKLEVVNDTFARITDASYYREESRRLDPVALRELIINAFVHNDYSLGDTPIIEQFSDRIVITSYGTLPQNLSRDDYFNGVSSPKNRELMRIFKDLELVEQLGSGMNRVMTVYDRSNFEFLDSVIRVTLPFKEGFEVKENSKSKEKIEDFLKLKPTCTTQELTELTGLSRSGVEKILKNLKEEGRLIRIGSDRNGSWKVVEK